jgi:hypothetical protein
MCQIKACPRRLSHSFQLSFDYQPG